MPRYLRPDQQPFRHHLQVSNCDAQALYRQRSAAEVILKSVLGRLTLAVLVHLANLYPDIHIIMLVAGSPQLQDRISSNLGV